MTVLSISISFCMRTRFKKKGKDENAGEKKIKFSDFLRGTHKSGAAKMRAEFKYKKALRNTKKKK